MHLDAGHHPAWNKKNEVQLFFGQLCLQTFSLYPYAHILSMLDLLEKRDKTHNKVKDEYN